MDEKLIESMKQAAEESHKKIKQPNEEKNARMKAQSSDKVDYSKVFTKEEMGSFEDKVASVVESESYKEGYIRSNGKIRAKEWQLFIKRNIPEGASHRGRMTGIFYKADEQGLSADFWGDGSGGWIKSGLFNTTLDEEKYFIKL